MARRYCSAYASQCQLNDNFFQISLAIRVLLLLVPFFSSDTELFQEAC